MRSTSWQDGAFTAFGVAVIAETTEAAILKRRQATTQLPDKNNNLPLLSKRVNDLAMCVFGRRRRRGACV